MAAHFDRTEGGAHVPDHDLVRSIGRGSFGDVWLGRTVIGSYRAVKIVYRNTFPDLRPFEREFAGVRKFEPISRTHPGLVAVLQVGRNDEKGYFYYIMEVADDLIRGQDIDPASYVPKSLRQYLAGKERLPAAETLRLSIALADSLAHLHDKGLVHRDIKPSNIIFVHGAPKLADIGLVTRIDEETGGDCTPGYVPREGPGAPTADIFAFGKVLYQMAMGKTLHQYPELPVQMGELEDTPQLIQLNAIIHRCCEPDVKDRIQSAVQLRDLLLEVHGGSPLGPLPGGSPQSGSALAPRKLKTTVVRPRKRSGEWQSARTLSPSKKPPQLNFRIAILYAPDSKVDCDLLDFLSEQFTGAGFQVYFDRRDAINTNWATDIQGPITAADAAIVLLSNQSVASEMLSYEVELAYQAAQYRSGDSLSPSNSGRPQSGRALAPRLLPVRVQYTGALPNTLAGILDPLPAFHWQGPQTNERLLEDLTRALEESLPHPHPHLHSHPHSGRALAPRLESIGGAVPLNSFFYQVRPTDHEFQTAVARRDSIVLVKGARQMGKTSLLARGLEQSRQAGAKVVTTDFQKLSSSHLSSVDSLFLSFAESLADQLFLDIFPADFWDKRRSPNTNFERFLKRHVFPAASTHTHPHSHPHSPSHPHPHSHSHLVWGLDEVDRLFSCSFASEVFGLFRAWHNERALDPGGPWSHLTMVMAYATEAHLFITDLNQSPFNVGTRLRLEDFTFKEVCELNRRYGTPLKTETELKGLYALLGGQPFLLRVAFNHLASGNISLDKLLETADLDDGIFGDHLRRILVLVVKDPGLVQTILTALRGDSRTDTTMFYRLRSAGIVTGESVGQLRFRCELYARYLRRHLQ